MIKPMDVTPEISRALATLRQAAAHSDEISNSLARAFNTLDNAGVFAEIDERNEYASAEEILAESAAMTLAPELDPAEWGDTSREDMARHQVDLGNGVRLQSGQGVDATRHQGLDLDRVRRSFGSLSADND